MLNNISVSAISELANEMRESPEEAVMKIGVEMDWQSGTRSHAETLPMEIGPHRINRDFSWDIDEPRQMLGNNHAPNPQEYLLSSLGSCMIVGFTVGASLMKIQLDSLKVIVTGQMNLAGLLGIGENVPVQLEQINYIIEVSGDGTLEQFEQLKEEAVNRSPNAMSIKQGVAIVGTMKVLQSKQEQLDTAE